jgi:hypothetical protein
MARSESFHEVSKENSYEAGYLIRQRHGPFSVLRQRIPLNSANGT